MVELDVTGDLLIFDGLETITLLQPDSAGVDQSTTIEDALRRNIPKREAANSNGEYSTEDTRFHFQTTDATPRIGDRITDQDGTTFTILEPWYDTLNSRWKCVARNLDVFYELDTIAKIQVAEFTQGTSGEQVCSWKTIATVTASIQEQGMNSQGETEKDVFADRTFEVILKTDKTVSPKHRIVDIKGNTYQVTSSSNKDNISALQSVICRPDPKNNNLTS